MLILLQSRAARTTLTGVAVAATCGVLLGAALHPDLERDRILAPQTLIAGGGQRSTAASDDNAGLARYGDHVPDYVIGTDWVRPPVSTQLPVSEPQAAVIYASRAQLPERVIAQPHWSEERTEPVVYPSSAGGVVYEADLPAPPPPPEDLDAVG